MSATDPPSERVVREIARHRGVHPTELDFQLYEHINPDALDQLVNRSEVARVEFRVDGTDVSVETDGDDVWVSVVATPEA